MDSWEDTEHANTEVDENKLDIFCLFLTFATQLMRNEGILSDADGALK